MKKTLFIVACSIVILTVLALLIKSETNRNYSTNLIKNNKLQVVASFYPLYFFSSEVGKDKASVHNMTPAGAEPHDYEPTTRDIALIEKSNLLILNGVNLEAWAKNIENMLHGQNIIIVEAAYGLASQNTEENGKTVQDPHIWLDPKLAIEMVKRISNGYYAADPVNKAYYETNEKNIIQELESLDQEYRTGLQNCRVRDIVTSHAAFGYLAKEYGLNQISVTGLSPDAEPSAKQLAEVAKVAKEKNIKYIFFENLVSPKLSETIANEIGAQTLAFDPLEGIAERDIQTGKNYFTIMKENLKNLRIALECQ